MALTVPWRIAPAAMNADSSSRAELVAEIARLRARLAAAEGGAARADGGHLALLAAVAAGNRPLAELLDHLARLVEAEQPAITCAILLYDAPHRRLRCGAAPSPPPAYRAKVESLPVDSAMGSCAAAFLDRRRVVVEEIATAPMCGPCRKVAAAYNLHACWSQPIITSGGELLGALVLYYHEARAPSAAEVDLIETAAHLVALAIERQRTEETLRRLNRALRAYGGCTRALLHASDEATFLAEICRVIVDEAGYRMAWVGLARADAQRTVEPVAQAGAEAGYLAAVDITWADTERGRGPTGIAVRTHTPQVAQDLLRDPAFAPWRAAATTRGYAALVALPFDGQGDHALGVLNVYAAEPRAFDDAEVALLAELAADVDLGLHTLRGQAERRALEAERTRLEGQLRQAQKMEAIGTLAGGIAHDFNNILQAVMGYAELAGDPLPPNHPTRANLAHILRAAQRASDLVHQILTFSRQTESRRRPCALQPVVKEALKLLSATLPATLKVHTHIDPTCPQAVADPTQIHQVVMNLATNAYHAIGATGGTLEVTLAGHREAAGEGAPEWLRLTVRDTGCGIDAATRERIFDPFFTTKPVGEGTGLGLAVVHGIVTDHGGRIAVESAAGRGTTVTIDLPVAATAAPVEPPATPVAKGRGERITVVDDDPEVAAILGVILTALGYRPAIFTDPRRALEAITAAPETTDLVLTDQVMPALSGTALAERLAKVRADLPVILLTGYSDEEGARCPALRARLAKPISAPDLALTLDRLLHPVLES